MNEIIYLNGSLMPANQARISALDYGFLYGLGLFETMRAYDGEVFRLDRHLSRLALSAETLGLSTGTLDLRKAIMATLQANKLSNARIRITISAGEGEMVPDPTSCAEPTVLIVAGYYQPYPEQTYEKGFRAILSSIRRNSQSLLSRIKSANYLESILARQEAKVAGVDEALFLNERGLLAEASMSNVFLITDGILRTPGPESGILPGITRETILELAPKLGIKTFEQDILPDELFQAQEAFLTNSLIEVIPLTHINRKPIASGKSGPITQKLLSAYRETVRVYPVLNTGMNE
ncbi:MAG: aminotransferase class IV [Dehalococcoidales bacterium]|jgi:branched-chain amino acid aminotransferase|nr:aminotransferase class IV [Dehalococcoidales bacterium]MDP7109988.1 aminotransferase class IV [Dehalococcoidales bacterium]MDP7310303.1 aminotransferase class IV [Dehalococcoidales bacterium]MDP7409919.1 aminotransferase class IV [Dehalococcoidales bacterium]MDP7675446.1 aminotransferase class IV [Dehalococcoidales bacterium]|tara:strand:- start:1172 stop:2050 length:879 start_codon:yes stop_codon:yes gene_type:complete